jgi:poly(A) polymerase
MAELEQYGPNKPLSLDPPSKRDLELNETLLGELKAQKNFESPDESKRR